MSQTTIERRQLAFDTAANWTAQNPILAMAEEGYETDTGKKKIGNGATAWSSLSYEPSKSTNTFTGMQTISDTTESSSTSTGCLVLAGGLGLAKKLTGVNAAFSGAVSTGALTVQGPYASLSVRISGNANGSIYRGEGLVILTNADSGLVDTYLIAGNVATSYLRFGIDNGTTVSEIMRMTTTGLAVTGDISVSTKTPANASAAGVAGTITWDASYVYVCTATNTWKRVAIATW